MVDATPVKSMFATMALVMLLDMIQLYVYGPAPPDTVAVHDTDCPTSNLTDEGHEERVGVVGGVYPAGIVNVPDSTLFVVSGVEAESVIITLASTVFPASAEGITHAKLLVVPVIPVKSMFATKFPVIVFTIR